jgi:hypothetical protein
MGYIFAFIKQIAHIIEKIHLTRIGVITSGLAPYQKYR